MMLLSLDEVIFQEEPRMYRLKGVGYRSVTDYVKEALGDDFANVPPERLAFCCGRGNAVHMAAELLMAGDLDWSTVDPRIEGYVRAVEKFHKDCPGKIIYTEKPLVDPVFGVGGRPDIVKFISGRRSLIDYKTSQQMKPRMRLQTAGYKRLHNALFPSAPIYDRYGLRLQADGDYKLVPHNDLDDELAFEDLVRFGKAKQTASRWFEKYGMAA